MRPVSITGLVLYAVVTSAALVLSPLALRPRLLPSSNTDLRTRELIEHVRRIAVAPHPLGTPEHDRVRDYIVSVLKTSGTLPEIQHASSVLDVSQLFRIADIQNILVRIPGTDPQAQAIVVASHYDSAPAALGAADDGAGVAIMLELARDLRRATPLRNTVILLFSDGEEWGLLGARSFLDHPWAQHVGMTINLDARGSSGRPVLIEMAGDQGRLLSLLSRTGTQFWAGSYATAGYLRSGYNTDFTVFKEADWPGYNFAFFDDPSSYHTLRDSVNRLNPVTVQQEAATVYELTRELGNTRLDTLQHQASSFYATLPGGWLLDIGEVWVKVLGAMPAVLLCIVILRSPPDWKPVFSSLARIAGAAVLSSLLIYLVNRTVSGHVGALVRWEQHDAFFAGSLCAVAGISWWTVSLRNSATHREYLLAFAIGTTVLSLISSIWFLQIAGLFSIPALSACWLLLWEWHRWSKRARVSVIDSLIYSVALLPAALLWCPAIFVIATGLGLRAQIVILPLAALLTCSIICLSLPMLIHTGWRLPAAALCAAAFCYGAGWRNAKFDFRNPLQDHLLLASDLESQTAQWATFDLNPDYWNGGFVSLGSRQNLRKYFGGGDFPVYVSPARSPGFAGSQLLQTARTNNRVDLLLKPEAGVSTVRMDFYIEGEIRSVSVGCRQLRPTTGNLASPGQANLTLAYLNPPSAGVPISLTLSGSREVNVSVVDVRYGAVPSNRPDNIVPSPQIPTDCALIRGTFHFELTNP